jgi:hypothetical protein
MLSYKSLSPACDSVQAHHLLYGVFVQSEPNGLPGSRQDSEEKVTVERM